MEGLRCVAAVWCHVTDGTRQVGVAVLRPRARDSKDDARRREVVLYQFLDTDRWANLESVLVSTRPAHVYVSDTLAPGECKKLVAIVSDACDGEGGDGADDHGAEGATVDVAAKSAFADGEVVAWLTKLAGEAVLGLDDVKGAAKAAACLVAKGKLTEEVDAAGGYAVRIASHDAFVRLDAAALRALNLFTTARDATAVAVAAAAATGSGAEAGSGPGASGGAGSKVVGASGRSGGGAVTSLHGLLSYGCKTKGGARLVKQWILQPLRDVAAIAARADVVQAFITSTTMRKAWREGLNVPDLEALAARLQRKNANLHDLLRMYQFAVLLPVIVSKLNAVAGDGSSGSDVTALLEPYTTRLTWAAGEFGKYMEMCEQVVEDVTSPEPRINPNWSADLKTVAEEREELEEQVMALYTQAMRTWGKDLSGDLKCERDKVRGYVFRVRAKNDKQVRAIPGVIITQVLKDGIHFTTSGPSGLRAISERLMDVEREYESQSRGLVAQAVDIARSYVPVLEVAATTVSELDAFCSLAHVAASAPGTYVRPTLTPAGTGDIDIKACRHPVMEMQDSTSFMPNDYHLTRDGSRFQIITGPNMGGKSTYIRSLGVVALMAQIGSFVPADSATLPVFDAICARIGAGDKAVKGVSTFMAEMMEASTILSTATPASLVIIDELGRGTSTYDGFGLAWSISEHLVHTTQCMTLFATHFHELTALQNCTPGVTNRHVTAHTTADSITMLYRVKDGPCPASFGIHVAELAAFPPAVIATARRKAVELEASTRVGAAAAAIGGGGGTHSCEGTGLLAKRAASLMVASASELNALPTAAAKRRRVAQLLAEAEAEATTPGGIPSALA